MTNYGYAPTAHDAELKREIATYLETLPLDPLGMRPYVERDGLYPGVRVRRLTHIANIDAICKALDAIYARVVG